MHENLLPLAGIHKATLSNIKCSIQKNQDAFCHSLYFELFSSNNTESRVDLHWESISMQWLKEQLISLHFQQNYRNLPQRNTQSQLTENNLLHAFWRHNCCLDYVFSKKAENVVSTFNFQLLVFLLTSYMHSVLQQFLLYELWCVT